MSSVKMLSTIVIILSVAILLLHQNPMGVLAANVNLESNRRPQRPTPRLAARIPVHYSKIRSDSLSDILGKHL